MRQRFEMRDKKGRYAICEYNKERGLLKITTHHYPDLSVPIEDVLKRVGYDIIVTTNIEDPKLVKITKGEIDESFQGHK